VGQLALITLGTMYLIVLCIMCSVMMLVIVRRPVLTSLIVLLKMQRIVSQLILVVVQLTSSVLNPPCRLLSILLLLRICLVIRRALLGYRVCHPVINLFLPLEVLKTYTSRQVLMRLMLGRIWGHHRLGWKLILMEGTEMLKVIRGT